MTNLIYSFKSGCLQAILDLAFENLVIRDALLYDHFLSAAKKSDYLMTSNI